MTHELELKRSNGDAVKIEIKLVTFGAYMNETDRLGNKYRYDAMTWIKPKGKITWHIADNIVTDAEIYAAKYELWNLIKP